MECVAISIDDIAIMLSIGPIDANEQTRLGVFAHDSTPSETGDGMLVDHASPTRKPFRELCRATSE